MVERKESDIHGKAFALAEVVAYQKGAIVSRTLIKRKSGSLTVFAFDEGQELSEHSVPYDALVLVLDGEAHITVAGRRHVVATGSALLMLADQPHSVRAERPFKMMLTMAKA